MFDIVAITAD